MVGFAIKMIERGRSMGKVRNQKEKKERKKKKSNLGIVIIPMVVGAIFGAGAASLGFDIGIDGMAEVASFGEGMICLGISIVFALYLNLILHEAGHMLCGLISGYRFCSFRIGSFILISRRGKLCLKRFHIPGTGGQCLMAPPEKDENGHYPSILYNLGGVLMNLIIAILGWLLLLVVENPFGSIFLNIAIFMGIIYALTNGIPLKYAGIANDGYNVYSLLKGKAGDACLYQQLDVYAKLMQGRRFGELSKEEVFVEGTVDYKNPLIATEKLNEYYWYLDQMRLEEAGQVLEEMAASQESIMMLVRNMMNAERLYLERITTNDQARIDELMTPELKSHLKKTNHDINMTRVCYSDALVSGDEKKIRRAQKQFERCVKNYPVEGEIKMNVMLIDYLKQKLEGEMSQAVNQ